MSAVANGVTAVAALVGLGLAWKGLDTWRHQLRGQHGFELARRLLLAVYRMRDAVRATRTHPMISQGELQRVREAKGIPPPTPGSTDVPGVTAVFEARWSAVVEAWSTAQTELMEAEVVWGASWDGALEPLNEMHRRLFRALRKHLESIATGTAHVLPKQDDTEIVEMIYGDIDDPFDSEYRKRVETLALKLREFLPRHD